MSSQEVLNQLPFYMQHPGEIMIALAIISMLGVMILAVGDSDKNYVLMFFDGALLIICWVVFLFVIVFSQSPTDKQIKILQQAPVRTVSTKTYDLVSAQSAGFAQTTVNGSRWIISGTTNDTTSYRYIIKSGDSYQVKTLHDQFGDVNANDVYIKQEPGRKNAQLVVETKEYEDPQVRRLIDHTSWASKWQTYTFKVGEDSINTKSEFK